jgi:predicted transcriptional regulator
MKQLLIELDADTAARLDKVAPARSRRRSEFVRMAIRKALWELEERATAEAYARLPDTIGDAYVDARVWEAAPQRRSPKRPR